MNLFSTDLAGKETKQLTTFKDFDIKFPSIGKDAIVFEQAGYIWRYDLASGKAAAVPIEIKEDLASGRSAFVDASKNNIQSVSTAPDAQRVIVVARGDLFSVPVKDGTARNLTKTSNAHERDAVWSPDGKWIAYNSDATGENELYVRSQDGKGQPQQITSGADTYYYQAIWSPDSKKLLWGDRLQRLRYVDVASKAVTQVDQDKEGEIPVTIGRPTASGSPGRGRRRTVADKVYLFSTADKKTTAVTDDWYSADNATFSDDGKYLMLTSSRDFRPIFGQADFSNVYRDMERVYLVTLSKETESPLGPRSDEVGKKKEKDKRRRRKEETPIKKRTRRNPTTRRLATPRTKTKTRTRKPRKPWSLRSTSTASRTASSLLKFRPAITAILRLVDDRIFYLRRTVGDQADDDDDGGGDDAATASLRLQPGRPQGDRPRRRQQLRDHR